VATAATSVREKHNAARIRNRNGKITVERDACSRHPNRSFDNPVGAHVTSLALVAGESYVSWGRMMTHPTGSLAISAEDRRLRSDLLGFDLTSVDSLSAVSDIAGPGVVQLRRISN
jgi:hypothetical protein